MNRKIKLSGEMNSLFVGNHNHIHLVAQPEFFVNGMVYCPRYNVDLSIDGDGVIRLRGVCREFVIRNAAGNCVIDLEHLRVGSFTCLNLERGVTVKLGDVKTIGSLNLEEGAHVISMQNPRLLRVISPMGMGKVEFLWSGAG